MYDEGFVVSLTGVWWSTYYVWLYQFAENGINLEGKREGRTKIRERGRDDRQDERIIIIRIYKRQRDTVMGN